MNRQQLLEAIAEALERSSKKIIEDIESAKSEGSPLVNYLYDPRKDAPDTSQSPPEPAPRKGGERLRHHVKGNGWKANHEGNV